MHQLCAELCIFANSFNENVSSMKRYFAILFFVFCLTVIPVFSQVQLSDSAKISLMTTSPWDGAVYAVYGHTAMWVKDDSTGIDAVFNYGYFDQSRPNFLYHFVRGETDYILGVVPIDHFLQEYREKGVEVIEQELNLTQKEKQNLWEALYINALPENREYRYNFLFDNCVTRPRDLTEKYVEGLIKYPDDTKVQTFRDLIHECVNAFPWMKFGIDLVIGSDADKPITLREKMFLPVYLQDALEESTIVKSDTLAYPAVKSTHVVLPLVNETNDKSEWRLFSPIIIAFAVLLLTLFVSIKQIITLNHTNLPKIYDTVLFGIIGIGGLIIFFLMFFSEHPVTNPNWNFAWMNIFALIAAALFWVKSARNIVYIYHFINFAVLIVFLLSWWFIPQKMPVASIVFSLGLLLRSGTNLVMMRRTRLKRKKFTSSSYMKAGWGN